jgi:hypothetical protein
MSATGKVICPIILWGFGDKKENWGIFDCFNPDEIEICFLFSDYLPKLRNLELMSKFKELKPGESLKVLHKYMLVEDLKAFLKSYQEDAK